MLYRLLFGVFLAWLAIGVAGGASPRVPGEVRQRMQGRQWAQAIAAIDAVPADAPLDHDYLQYLRGRALHLQEDYEAAVAAFETLGRRFPDSPWARQARFAAGVSLARKGDYRAAERVYRSEAEYLFSPDRKQEVAEIYLEYADAWFDPPEEDPQPDYAQALDSYQRALDVGPAEETAIRVRLRIARCRQLLDEREESAKLYRGFIEEFGDQPLAVEARYRLGETLLADGQLVDARHAWRDLLDLYGDADSDLLPQAAFHLSETYRLPKPQDDEDLSLGVTSLRRFLQRYPEHDLAGRAHLRIAESYRNRSRFEEAGKALTAFLEDPRYADYEQVPDARRLLATAYQMQARFDEAIEAWRTFLTRHPTHPAWSDVQQQIVACQYQQALDRFQRKDYAQARSLWEAFLASYPLDERAARIQYLFGQIDFAQQHWKAAIEQWRRVVSKYPGTQEASRAQYMIAWVLEERLGKLDEALKEYRKLDWGRFRSQAQARVRRLTSRAMKIATERVYRSDETPKLKLTTRNIQSVTVQVYAIDMETYFRKMHDARGIEALDIALIDPDAAFTFEVPDYRPHARLENFIEVPLPSPAAGGDSQAARAGVMAVTVSSRTLEATALVLQSDLDVIVKSSRDEVFVFAENLRTGKPWPAARVLLSDGTRVFSEGETGEDGVFRGTFEPLESAGEVRCFVSGGPHAAASLVSLDGLGVAQGLAPKGYVYTDRPAYRPGQIVHIRGVLRQVAEDTFRVAEGKAYRIDVYDSRNRQIHDGEVTLDKFGGFHTHLLLSSATVPGTCRIVVHDQQKENYTGSFLVADYRLEPIRVEIDTPRAVFYRGEQVRGTIRVSYYYGAPLAGREIRYGFAGQRVLTGTTDEAGEVAFALETREFRESAQLALSAELPEQNLQAQKTIYLATQGFSLAAETIRDVYLAGETFELKATAADAEGQPVQPELELQVLKRTEIDGRSGETPVESFALKADAEGVARKTLRLDQSGGYILRVSGEDRFSNLIQTACEVQISGDDDRIRLRILADQHHFRVGDTAAVRIHWREAPALGLVTFQGARILGYRLVPLQRGINRLSIPVTAELAPNFDLAVAVMTDGDRGAPVKAKLAAPEPPDAGESDGAAAEAVRFHEASSPFEVERELKLRFEIRRPEGEGGGGKHWKPDEPVEVVVTASDAQGKPVAAQLSLAMVEQSLLKRFPRSLPKIHEFFRNVRRESAVRTISSISFSDRPQTQPINPRLLAEAERQELEQLEAERLEELAAAGVGEASGEYEEEYGYADQDGDPAVQLDNLFSDSGVNPFGAGNASGVDFSGLMARDAFGNTAAPQSDANARFGKQIQLADSIADPFGGRANGQTFGFSMQGGMGGMGGMGGGFFGGGGQAGREVVPWYFDFQRDAAADAKLPLHETGYWNPAVVTGEDGTATVSLTLPDRSTGWHVLARGVTVDTLAGEAEQEFAASKALFGQLKLPAALTDGDTVQVQATIHNDLLDDGEIQAALSVRIGDKTTVQRKTLAVTGKGIQTLQFPCEVRLPEQAAAAGSPEQPAEFELTVTAGGETDTLRRAVPIRPDGMLVYSIAGASAAGDAAAFVQPPSGMTLAAPRMQILIGPSVERSLLDAVLAPPVWCQVAGARYASDADSAVSDLMAALALQRLVAATRDADSPQASSLDSRVRSTISLLVSLQNEDGGWSWTASVKNASDPYPSARTLWALQLARDAGYRIPDAVFNQAVRFVETALSQSAVTDYETKAVLLHALTVAGKSDFPLANQLYRVRPSLSHAGLAYLSLLYAEMDRKPIARELLDLLADRGWEESPEGAEPAVPASLARLSWNRSQIEIRALAALALTAAAPDDPRLREHVEWLMARKTGHRWQPDKATGPAMLAVCGWYARSRFEADRYTLDVYVNDYLAEQLEIDDRSTTRVIDVPAELLDADAETQQVRFELNGRGRYTYQCILGGFVPSDGLQGTWPQWKLTRHYQPAPVERDGRPIARGFDVAVTQAEDRFRNPLSQLPVGRRGVVTLDLVRLASTNQLQDPQLPYLVLTEPLPAGAAVVENSVQGPFERYEVSPGQITFYVGARRGSGQFTYEIHGYLPGQYATIPAVVRDAYQPDRIAVAEAKRLRVLPGGESSPDPYRWTPRELYELGRLYFGKHEYAAAGKYLNELFDNWVLTPEIYRETVRMLLDVHLAQGPPNLVVRDFEIIIEKFPDLEIPFPKLLRVADAYDRIGEYERSYLVFRATIEANFLRESRVAGFLEAQDRFLRSVEVMTDLLRQYPPEPYQATAAYALSQRIYAKAPEAADDPRLREQSVTRVDLIRDAWNRLEDFLTEHPDDPAADEAAFSAANALLDLELYDRAIARCRAYADRYPDSDFLDSYWYIIGFCQFALGHTDPALEMCRQVAQATRRDPQTGRVEDSRNKWRAIYILGQIHHSLGAAEAAIAEYRRVQDRFADAREAIEYFTRKAIELPEVETFRPGQAVELELRHRNVGSCQVTVYRVDLMKFSLLRRNLSDIAGINLAGIRPYHQQTVALGDGRDFRERTTQLALPLKDQGAYLVVGRGENRYASGMVLVSPLDLEIQEEAASGRVRVTVRDRVEQGYVPEADVKVIGADNADFVSGESDLRGIFVADGIRGRSTVIARAESGAYAFYRGQVPLGPPPPAPAESNADAADVEMPSAQPQAGGKAGLLEGLKGTNEAIQMEQQKQLQEVYENTIDEGIGGGFGGGFF